MKVPSQILNLADKGPLIIVDPYWELEPEDEARFPGHQLECRQFVESHLMPLIEVFSQVIVATWSTDSPVHPKLKKFPRLFTKEELIEQASSKDLFYCGFHYGRCLLRMPLGINALHEAGFRCHILHDYSVFFPEDNPEKMVERSQKSGAIIIR